MDTSFNPPLSSSSSSSSSFKAHQSIVHVSRSPIAHFSPMPRPPPASASILSVNPNPTASASVFSLNPNPNLKSNRNPKRQVKVNSDDTGRMMLANSNTSYIAAPLDVNSGSSFMMRPLAEILRDLNKKVPDQVLKEGPENKKYIPWYQANRMLSFYAPGWCGEVRDITFSADGKFVTVIYRVTIRGSDGEAFREASGTICTSDVNTGDPTQQAEAIAFVRACARFGLGLYLHHVESQ